MSPPLYLLASYLIGAFPTSYLLGRFHGLDLRDEGSGNLGGTNAFRVLGPGAAAIVLPIDLFKGFIPAWFFPPLDGSPGEEWALAYGLCAMAGHIWPVFTRFKGGKGVATGAGAVLALAPVAALIGILLWIGIVLLTRTASFASLVAATVVPAIAYASAAPPYTVLLTIGLSATVWWTHRHNITRLIQRRELTLAPRGKTDDAEQGQ